MILIAPLKMLYFLTGFVIDFISVPVTAGFTSAAAITIASGQVKSIFGLKIDHSSHTEGIAGTWIDVIDNFDTARVNDSILGISCIVILLCMRVSHYKRRKTSINAAKSRKTSQKAAKSRKNDAKRRKTTQNDAKRSKTMQNDAKRPKLK